MAETRLLERLTASDLFLLRWDHYGWSSDIGGLAILDGSSLLDDEDRVRIDVIRQHLESRVHLAPRFRQLLYRPRRGLGWPLWELWLLPGLAQRRVGALLRVHHAVADGGAALAAFGALLDQTADTHNPAAPPWTTTPIPSAGELLRDNVRRRRQELGRGWSGLVHPRRTMRLARRSLPAWREVLTERPAPRTSLNRPVGAERQLAVVEGRLDLAEQIAHDHDAKVNDVVLAAVTRGLRDLLASRVEDLHGMVQRAMATISQHDQQPGQAQGNKPGWMMVPLPRASPTRCAGSS